MEMDKEIKRRQQIKKRCLFGKKLIVFCFSMAVTACLSTINAFAADGTTFMNDAVDTMSTVVTLIGGGVAVWGVVNLLEGYGNDNPGSKAQGMKQLMAGIGLILLAQGLVPKLKDLLTTTTTTKE